MIILKNLTLTFHPAMAVRVPLTGTRAKADLPRSMFPSSVQESAAGSYLEQKQAEHLMM